MSDIQYKAAHAITTASGSKGGNRKTFAPGELLVGFSDEELAAMVKSGAAVRVRESTVLQEVVSGGEGGGTGDAPATGSGAAGGTGTGGAAGGQPA